MSSSKELSLARLYRAMDREEIERRLERGDLTEAAAIAARNELARRERVEAYDLARTPWQVALTVLAGALIVGALAYWIMPSELFWLIAVSLLPGVAMVIGKALPTLGRFIGTLLLATPLWLGLWMQHSGMLKMQGGDYRPLGAVLAWGALIIVSFFGIVVGHNLWRGAQHTGSWNDLEKEINAERKAAMDDIRRAD